MIKQSDKILAEELVKKGLISQEDVDKCIALASNSEESLRSYIIKSHFSSEEKMLETLANKLGIETIDFKNISVDKYVIERIPVRFARYYNFMPVKIENKIVTLACSAPLGIKFEDEIRVHLGYQPRVLLAKEYDINTAQAKYYGLAADTIDQLKKKKKTSKISDKKEDEWVEDLEKSVDGASIAKLVNQILLEAYKKRATDIHIEPYRDVVRIRYRIDGVLVDANIPAAAKQFLPSVISRIKLMANLSIVEKRLPQDGSTVVRTKDQKLDLRISTIPTPQGESMVIRILPTNVMLLSLKELGLEKDNLEVFKRLIKKPHGIILVTGPTGSGKTTTLYACLNEINSPDRKIITLEDPLEYEMEGVTQIQVNNKVNLTFAMGLRSVLRHDPDIIMVGEVRDFETAEIAIRTALTGHLVFSTLHTNDAASGVTRLVEMGLEPFLVASSIEAFVAQRLVRVICPKCKEEVKSSLTDLRTEIAESLDIKDINLIKIFQGVGCDYCHQTGFYGRTAIYEILEINEDIRSAILDRKRADEIKQIAVKHGMETLRQHGWRNVIGGITTPMEILNATMKDADFLSRSSNVLKDAPSEESPLSIFPNYHKHVVSQEVQESENTYNARAYPRLKERVGVRYSVLKQDKEDPTKYETDGIEHFSLTKDISAGGLRFVSGYTLPLGTIIEVKIQLERSERSINCLAKVCRVEDDNLSSMYNLVAYYLDIASADRVKIGVFIKKCMEKDRKI